ncbi:MAG TPA: translation initiation factor [Candidatus Nanoarchaeia archaeon]|nr:hypothetical protein [uncultured archaeon]AQS34170.1 hypothetical protein [uncultured archaeon]HLC56548.1 translation initiation factor [Candidatus Nanoarchaeia archaeon]
MIDVCPTCGLNKQLCVCETIAKEGQRIKVRMVKRRFGKMITLIEGLDASIDVKEIAKSLKSKLACGGTVKSKIIELQGDHVQKAKEELVKLGFKTDTIETI